MQPYQDDFNYGEFAIVNSLEFEGIRNEADLLNVALFGKTAKQWREAQPDADGNLRDQATLEQLVVLSNLESLNSVLIRKSLPQAERLVTLNQIVITQMRSLLASSSMKAEAQYAARRGAVHRHGLPGRKRCLKHK